MRTVICTSVIATYDDGKQTMVTTTTVTGTASANDVGDDLHLMVETMKDQLSKNGRLESVSEIKRS